MTPTPDVHDLITRDDRHGIVLSRVEGPTARDALFAHPWRVVGFARRAARLHASLHSQAVSSLPPARDSLVARVKDGPLPQMAREYVLTQLDALPAEETLCHGDFHPEYVLLTDDGPVVIDWMDATTGHPAVDVAHTALLVRFRDRSKDG